MLRIIWLGLTLSIVLVLALITGFKPLFWLLYIFVGGSAISYGMAWFQSRGLEISTQGLSEYPRVGQPIDLLVSVKEKLGLPRLGLRVRFQSAVDVDERGINLPAHGTSTWRVTDVCSKRGWNNIGGFTVVASDITQSLEAHWAKGEPQHILVHPPTVEVPGVGLLQAVNTGEISERGPLAGTSQTAFAVRDYIPGDNLNQIHWPTSAKNSRLMTKQFEGAGRNEVWLFLDMEREAHVGTGANGTEEYCVTITASLAKAFIEGGCAVGLVCEGSNFDRIVPDRGTDHFWTISRTLAQVQADSRSPFLGLLEREAGNLPAGSELVLISTWPGMDMSGIRSFLSRRAISLLPLLVDTSSFGIRNPSREIFVPGGGYQQSTFLIRKGDDLSSVLGMARDHLASS